MGNKSNMSTFNVINGEEKSPLKQVFHKKIYSMERTNPIAWDQNANVSDDEGGLNTKNYGGQINFQSSA
jgi:hypothetical protein